MGMSAGGNDGLFRLAENAAPEDDRIMPTERTYAKSSKTVSINEAIALMKKRRENPELRIEGGLDDTSEKVRKSYVEKIAKERKSAEKAVITQSILEGMNPGQNLLPEVGLQENMPFVQRPCESAPVRIDKVTGRVTTADLMNGINGMREMIGSSLLQIGNGIDSLADIVRRQEPDIQKPSKEEDKETDPLSDFKSGSHRVTFILNGMEFTVKCLNMIKDSSSHTLVLTFEDGGESFFTPPMQSELKIRYDGLEEGGHLFYFGMCFSVKSLGLKFLGFLFDEGNQAVPETTQD